TDGRSLHRRLAEPLMKDELGRLAETLNQMMTRLERSFAALRRSCARAGSSSGSARSEEHTSELQSRRDIVCRLLLEKKKKPKKRASSVLIHFEDTFFIRSTSSAWETVRGSVVTM